MSTVWRPSRHVRPIAIGLIRRGEALLAAAVHDDFGSIKGWRPLGGGIEHGERAADALRRELIEELGLAVSAPRLVAVIENIYEHHGAPGHEIVFVLEASFTDPGAYGREIFAVCEGGMKSEARWIDIQRFRSGEHQLYPTGLIAHLT